MGSLGTLVCFVFAIPAALIIYTLSLHDALPISGESLVDLIHASGGLRPDAAMKRLSVFRLLPAAERGPGTPPRSVIDVSLSPLPSPPDGRGEKAEVPPGDPPLPVTMPSMALEDG